MFLLFQLAGCCCCCCSGSSNPPVPVPSSQSQYLGSWVCGNGDAWTFRPDGTYTFRSEVTEPEDGRITTYENAVWRLDEGSLLGVPLPGIQEAGAQVSVAMNPPCAMLQGEACVRSVGAPPEHLRGRWTSTEGNVEVEVRDDGFARVTLDGAVHTGTLEVPAETGVQATLLVCGAPIPLPFTVVDGPDRGLVIDGEPMDLVEPDYDATRIQAEADRRRSTSGGGGGGGSDYDYDRDYDYD